MVPMAAVPPARPLTLQVTAALSLPFPDTVAVNSCAPPAGTVALVGEIDTPMPEDTGGGFGAGGFSPGGVPAYPQPCARITTALTAAKMNLRACDASEDRVVRKGFTCATDARDVPRRSRLRIGAKAGEATDQPPSLCGDKCLIDNRIGVSTAGVVLVGRPRERIAIARTGDEHRPISKLAAIHFGAENRAGQLLNATCARELRAAQPLFP